MTSRAPIADDPGKLAELLSLIEGADSVELKLTVPDNNKRSSVKSLGMDPLEAEIRQVFFFDTPDLQLNQAGVVVRARRVRAGDDSVVKLRPVVPSELPPEVRKSPDVKVEVDALPGGFVCSASYKGALGAGAVKDVLSAGKSCKKLFSKQQRSFYKDHAPDGIGLDDLTALGPITLLKLKFAPKRLGRKMVAELWLYPDGTNILELSTKCAPVQTFQVAAECKSYLGQAGVDLSGEQATKTAKALKFLAGELAATAS